MTPQVGSRRTVRWCDGQPSEVDEEPLFEKDLNMPQDKLVELVGDGRARVTISIEQKDSNYGSGFGAFASVTLSCSQETGSIERAGQLATGLASQLAAEAWEKSRDLFDTTHPSE